MCNEALERMRRGIAGPRELELWRMQVAALEVRNHVCLVLSTRRRGDQLTASAVTLSRLKASVVDRSLARRILYGEREGGVPTRAEAEVQAGSEAAAEAVVEAEVDRFLAAFGGQAATPNPNPGPSPNPDPDPNPNPNPGRLVRARAEAEAGGRDAELGRGHMLEVVLGVRLVRVRVRVRVRVSSPPTPTKRAPSAAESAP